LGGGTANNAFLKNTFLPTHPLFVIIQTKQMDKGNFENILPSPVERPSATTLIRVGKISIDPDGSNIFDDKPTLVEDIQNLSNEFSEGIDII
jgi:hypothetical protein